ncbi:hypothetical protein Lalb_Chr02g0152201 [Lupinus albus]|uniref:Uncharacterized protein n=1 Tax=Lupinus albus TaxID=3870 RepID=A0A6A4R165_LUPAL|nr:hypothetical protein Lalb_Chr02g0152201 [Lupinus albus]
MNNMCRCTRSKHLSVLLWLQILVMSLLFIGIIQCQEMNDYEQINNPSVLPLITQIVYTRLSNLTSLLSQQISSQSTFCVKDP